MPSVARKSTAILALDRDVLGCLPPSAGYRIYRRINEKILERHASLYVSVSLRNLHTAADFVRKAHRRRHLEQLLVHDPDASNLLPQYLRKADLRLLRNLIVHHGPEVPARILNAMAIGAQNELIADARLVEDQLVVVSCAGDATEVPISQIPTLSKRDRTEIEHFHVESDGSYVRWPSLDVDLDMDSFRQLTDPAYEAKAQQDRLLSDRRFGQAVSSVRKQHGLPQSGIPGLSERQIRRIEGGSRPRVTTIEQLAQAHGLTTITYLETIAHYLQEEQL